MPTIDPDALRDNAAQASQLLTALSHPDRLMLLCRLAEGERSVSELEPLVEVYQPSLSQQLGILRREGLVSSRREGKQMFYQVANPDALAVLHVLYQRFCEGDHDH